MRPIGAVVRALLAILVLSLGASGCKRKPSPLSGIDTITNGDGTGVAEPGGDSGPQLGFTITTVYTAQKPSSAAPWHEAGGTWTFFYAKTKDGAVFAFGFDTGRPLGGGMAFADVMLTVPDRSSGVKLTNALAASFKGKLPPELPPQPLAPKPFKAVFLAADAKRTGNGFSGTGGGYYATKLFLQRRDLEAEVFFNFSLSDKKGSFAEKDADYADELVAFVALELRDGPRAQRTPATDPTMSERGPRVRWLRDLPGKPHGMAPERDRYWTTETAPGGGVKLFSVGFDKEGDKKEVMRVPHALGSVYCRGDLCVAEDSVREQPNVSSSTDPRTLFTFDASTGTGTELKGPWGKAVGVATGAAVSPAGDLFFASDVVPNPGGPMPFKHVVYLVDRAGAVRGPVDFGGGSWEIESSDVAAGKTTRVLVRKTAYLDGGATRSYVAVDPKTLAVSPAAGPPAPNPKLVTSPNGKRTVECLPDALVVRDRAAKTERRFPIHEDDRKTLASDCVSWASDRFLSYPGAFPSGGIIDVETMKLSEGLAKPEPEASAIEVDKTFTWAVSSKGDVARVGRIVVE